MRPTGKFKHRMQGAIAIIVGLAIAVMIAFLGVVIDLGHLYVIKTELSNAADACALAAAKELDGQSDALTRSESAASTVTSRNLEDFQNKTVAFNVNPNPTVTFSDHLSNPYYSKTSAPGSITGGIPKIRYAKCTFTQDGILPWFMEVMGFGAQTVASHAIAALEPGYSACTLPIALVVDQAPPAQCASPDYPNPADTTHGYCVGQWYGGVRAGAGAGSGGFSGAYNWISFNSTGSTTNQTMEDWLAHGYCKATIGQQLKGQPGMIEKFAGYWNTRFGLYANGLGETPSTAQPDLSGFAYTPSTWSSLPLPNAFNGTPASGVTAQNFVTATKPTASPPYTPYQASDPDNVISGGSTFRDTNLGTDGAPDRRVQYLPIISTWASGLNTPLLNLACVLLLEPMGGPGSTTNIEYRGLADAPGSPCSSITATGGTSGPKVPTLVR